MCFFYLWYSRGIGIELQRVTVFTLFQSKPTTQEKMWVLAWLCIKVFLKWWEIQLKRRKHPIHRNHGKWVDVWLKLQFESHKLNILSDIRQHSMNRKMWCSWIFWIKSTDEAAQPKRCGGYSGQGSNKIYVVVADADRCADCNTAEDGGFSNTHLNLAFTKSKNLSISSKKVKKKN